ncbi:MAG: hypothetical protein GDA67_00700 [Nitrospira sp. CR1.3]|nr:hypothetical protein [Nitrospira sp. CR1.3]
MKVIRIRIGLLPPGTVRSQKRFDHRLKRNKADSTPPDDESHYWAEAIQDGDKFYYLVNDAILEISEYEFGKVILNPYLYYFSTALKLHKRIERAKQATESWSLGRT